LTRLLPIALAILAIAAISRLRVALNAGFAKATVEHDIYPLPPPQQTVVLSLGYRSALADFLFAHLLVSYGIHFQEKRQFEVVGNYLDAINELDPKFERPYRLADTLLTLQVKQVSENSYRKARAIEERGMKEFPFDAALWSSAGQFLAYLGPGGLKDRAEQDAWRLAGGRVLAHACELVSSDETIPYHCIVAAGLLADTAAKEAFLERVLLVNDDPEILALANGALEKLNHDARNHSSERKERFQKAEAADLPFISLSAYLTIGPNWDPPACAGRTMQCPTSFRAWDAANNQSSDFDN
jgi:tetratricopeptide (TPR) repeat protein